MIKRKIEEKLKAVAEKFQVTAIFGPRQAGKTTLAISTFPGFIYKNLEDPTERDFALEDPKSFLKDAEKGIILDEIQRVPELFSYIQVLVDSNRNAKFILTGSQNYLLMENISQSLAGRIYIMRLLPFSINELKDKYNFIDYSESIVRGFFPPVFDRDIAAIDWMPSYVQTYLERDVRQIRNVTDLNAFAKFLKLCAGRTGQILNISSLASDAGVSNNTVKSWISVLETGYMIYLLRPYYKNFNKRLIKSSKLYFIDAGITSSLLDIKTPSQAEIHFLKGGLFENLAIMEILKHFANKGETPQLYFWRDNHGNEIDCLFEINGVLYAIEMKAGRTISKSYFKGLNFFSKIFDGGELKKYVIYGGDQIQERKEGTVLPWNEIGRIFE